MITDLLVYIQAVSGGYVTPYGFYVPLDNYTFIFWKDILIGFLFAAALYYRIRFRRGIKKKEPEDNGLQRIKGTNIILNKEKMGVGGKLKASGPVQALTQRSAKTERIPPSYRQEMPSSGKNFYKNMELTLTAAVRTGKEVTIEYINGEGAVSERRILPRNLYTRFDKTYLVAWCYLRGEERTFRVDRVFSARFVDYDRNAI